MKDLKRNEVSIDLAGESRVMKASFNAIRHIERDLGRSIIGIIEDFGMKGDVSITALSMIIFRGLQAYPDTRLSLDDVGEAVLEAGIEKTSLPVVEFLKVAIMGASLGKPEGAAG